MLAQVTPVDYETSSLDRALQGYYETAKLSSVEGAQILIFKFQASGESLHTSTSRQIECQ